MDDVVYELWLLGVFGTASRTAEKLVKLHGSARGVYENADSLDCFLKPAERARAFTSSIDSARRTAEYCDQNDVHIICIGDDGYSALLREIPYPPRLLFLMGNTTALNADIPLCVVGTRNPALYSVRVAETLCAELVAAGVTLVSGFAHGIDEIAHNAAVHAGKPTVAVLACGISIDYPTGSVKRRRDIIDAGGAVISELLPAEKTSGSYFRIRNRIMSGLSKGTLIIQAGERSGCHITAGHADAQNRDIFCVPPYDIFDKSCTGAVKYLRDGATPVFGAEDIIIRYVDFDFDTPKRDGVTHIAKTSQTSRTTAATSKDGATVTETEAVLDLSSYSDDCQKIIALFDSENRLFPETVMDESTLNSSADSTIDNAYVALMELEAGGVIRNVPGGWYELV